MTGSRCACSQCQTAKLFSPTVVHENLAHTSFSPYDSKTRPTYLAITTSWPFVLLEACSKLVQSEGRSKTCYQAYIHLLYTAHIASSSTVVLLLSIHIAMIGASVSKPHTSEFNSGISLIHVSYVHPMHAYAPCMRTTCV